MKTKYAHSVFFKLFPNCKVFSQRNFKNIHSNHIYIVKELCERMQKNAQSLTISYIYIQYACSYSKIFQKVNKSIFKYIVLK